MRTSVRAMVLPVATALLLLPAAARAEEPTPAPTTTPPAAADPMESGKALNARRHAALIAQARAQAAAAQAVAEARTTLSRAQARQRTAHAEVVRLQRRSAAAAAEAETLRRQLGNLARLAYSGAPSELMLVELLLDAGLTTDALTRWGDAERAAAHKGVAMTDVLAVQARADRLAAQAEEIAHDAEQAVTDARAVLESATALAASVRLALAPTADAPAVDMTTASDWVFPVPGAAIGSEAGMRFHPILHVVRCHAGADIGAAAGTPIYAVDDGVVLSAGMQSGYGNFTLIAHDNGVTSGYGHQQLILVKPGDVVRRGQLIGEVGSTGLSTGPHLHFEARVGGVPFNPRGWLEDHPELRVPVC